jgi:hypothetical protein
MESQEPIETRVRGAERGSRVASRLVFGGFLILVGVLLLAGELGFDLARSAWSYWPFLLIAMGAAKLLVGGRDGIEGGFWILMSGLYCAISTFGWFGLGWGSAWPLFLLAAGVWIAVGVPLARRAARREEVRHGG